MLPLEGANFCKFYRDLIVSDMHQGGASRWFVRLISFAMSRNHVTKSTVMGCEFERFSSIMLSEIFFKSQVSGIRSREPPAMIQVSVL